MELGDRLKFVREAREMSQDELAKALGYKSRSTINKIEMNKNQMPLDKIKQAAKVLDVNEYFLLGLDENPGLRSPGPELWSMFDEQYQIITPMEYMNKAFQKPKSSKTLFHVVSKPSIRAEMQRISLDVHSALDRLNYQGLQKAKIAIDRLLNDSENTDKKELEEAIKLEEFQDDLFVNHGRTEKEKDEK